MTNKALSRILIIDDDQDMRVSLADLLSEEGYTVEDLPPHLTATKGGVTSLRSAFLSQHSLADIEREYILAGIELTGGNKKEMADILRVDRKTLYRRLKEYGWKEN